MGSVNIYCERIVELNETIRVKKCRYHDPKGRLNGLAGRTLLVENPHNSKHNPHSLSVYDKHKFYITTIVPMEGEIPGTIPPSCLREVKRDKNNRKIEMD